MYYVNFPCLRTKLSWFVEVYIGNSNWVHAMEWSGKREFGAAPSINFTVEGEDKGVQKNHGPLTFLKVHDAGHMVPMDQPKAALAMLQRWTQGKLSNTWIKRSTIRYL